MPYSVLLLFTMTTQIKQFLIGIIAQGFQATTWVIMRISFKLFGKLTVTGIENIKNIKGPVIFAPNHANLMDAIFFRAAMPISSQHTELYYVTAPFKRYKEVVSNKFAKRIYRFVPFSIIGAVAMIPNSGDYHTALEKHIKLLQRGKSVCIFPEGKMTRDGKLGKPRGGVAYMAQATHAPIIPVSISGTFGLTLKKFFTSHPTVTIHFDDPMYASDIVPTILPHDIRYREASEHIFEKIQSRLV